MKKSFLFIFELFESYLDILLNLKFKKRKVTASKLDYFIYFSKTFHYYLPIIYYIKMMLNFFFFFKFFIIGLTKKKQKLSLIFSQKRNYIIIQFFFCLIFILNFSFYYDFL